MRISYRRFPHLTLFLFLFLLPALACSLSSETAAEPTSPAGGVASEAVVRAAVATIQAQTPAKSAGQDGAAVQVSPGVLPAGVSSDLEGQLVDLYRRVNPSVVEIFTLTAGTPLGSGSGFVYDDQGHVVTNNHVVEGGDGYEVVFADGQRRRADLIGRDVDSDLAVIQVESLPEGIEPLPLGDSGALNVGQFVVAIGSPFREQGSMSMGIVSGLGRSLESQRIAATGGTYQLPGVIQTDAPINPGNSGGPLLSLRGEVIGVNSAIRSTTGVNSGVGFAIPVNAVRRIIPALIETGAYTYPYMGVALETLDLNLRERFGFSADTAGAYVSRVDSDTPAEAAGLIGNTGPGGDLITGIDGQEVNDADDLISYLVFEAEVGQTVQLVVLRDGETITVPLTLGARP